jgi:hypothetical protein
MRATSKQDKHNKKSDALAESVFRVVAAYVAHLGGEVIVSGPIGIETWPSEGEFKFKVTIKCTGKKPPNVELRGSALLRSPA